MKRPSRAKLQGIVSSPRTLLTVDFSMISGRASGLYRAGVLAMGTLTALAAFRLLFSRPDFLLPFVAIALPALVGLMVWSGSKHAGLPLLPVFLSQHALIYGLPLAIDHPGLTDISREVIAASGMGVGLFLACCVVGWYGGQQLGPSRPSKANLEVPGGGSATDRCLSLAFLLLSVALMFHLTSRAGLIFKLLPDDFSRLFPVIRTFATAAGMLGALLGGLAVAGRPNHFRTWIYWAFLAAIFVLSVADVLLSGASGLILSAAVGLALGKRKIPLTFLFVAFAVVGFLNQGKFVMRERYWSGDSNTTQIAVSRIPTFFIEWAGASATLLMGGGAAGQGLPQAADGDEGQSILERVNNMQNMVFVIEAINQRKTPLLMGETYALIPPLFVPRIFWADKPRTHEGQIRLNLHFGRQANVGQTERTYIAWGLLPEAVGNFGVWLGPVILGLVMGCGMGWLEVVSLRKRLFSVEGMVLSGLLLITAGSYEQVASIFLTSTFQFLVAVTVGGFVLRAWFGAGAGPAKPGNRRRTGAPRGARIAPAHGAAGVHKDDRER